MKVLLSISCILYFLIGHVEAQEEQKPSILVSAKSEVRNFVISPDRTFMLYTISPKWNVIEIRRLNFVSKKDELIIAFRSSNKRSKKDIGFIREIAISPDSSFIVFTYYLTYDYRYEMALLNLKTKSVPKVLIKDAELIKNLKISSNRERVYFLASPGKGLNNRSFPEYLSLSTGKISKATTQEYSTYSLAGSSTNVNGETSYYLNYKSENDIQRVRLSLNTGKLEEIGKVTQNYGNKTDLKKNLALILDDGSRLILDSGDICCSGGESEIRILDSQTGEVINLSEHISKFGLKRISVLDQLGKYLVVRQQEVVGSNYKQVYYKINIETFDAELIIDGEGNVFETILSLVKK